MNNQEHESNDLEPADEIIYATKRIHMDANDYAHDGLIDYSSSFMASSFESDMAPIMKQRQNRLRSSHFINNNGNNSKKCVQFNLSTSEATKLDKPQQTTLMNGETFVNSKSTNSFKKLLFAQADSSPLNASRMCELFNSEQSTIPLGNSTEMFIDRSELQTEAYLTSARSQTVEENEPTKPTVPALEKETTPCVTYTISCPSELNLNVSRMVSCFVLFGNIKDVVGDNDKISLKCSVCQHSFVDINGLIAHKEDSELCRYNVNIKLANINLFKKKKRKKKQLTDFDEYNNHHLNAKRQYGKQGLLSKVSNAKLDAAFNLESYYEDEDEFSDREVELDRDASTPKSDGGLGEDSNDEPDSVDEFLSEDSDFAEALDAAKLGQSLKKPLKLRKFEMKAFSELSCSSNPKSAKKTSSDGGDECSNK